MRLDHLLSRENNLLREDINLSFGSIKGPPRFRAFPCQSRSPENDTERISSVNPLDFRPSRFRASSSISFEIIDLEMKTSGFPSVLLPRKEVIQPHLPIRLPCYDFTPVIGLTLDGWLLAVTSPVSGAANSHGVTGGVYKARERIHRGMLIRDY